jgi:hypothetical protein
MDTAFAWSKSMKILLPVVAALFVMVQSGCGGDSNSSSPTPATNPATPVPAVATPTPSGSAWSQTSERTSCSFGTAENCIGAYGFTVLSNGSYQVGPAPTGLLLSGSLAPGEADVINQDALSVAAGNLTGAYTCAGSNESPGNRDDVSILFGGQNTADVVYREFLIGVGSDCYIGNANAAFQLHTDLNRLMTEYYPIPFPSPTASPSPTPSASPSGTPVQNGDWGGKGITASVGSEKTTFDFNCAQGETNGPLVQAANGTFSESGTYSNEAGPIIQGDPREYATTYSGTVSGNQMDLTISYTNFLGTPVTLNFTLTLGQTGIIDPICPLT